MQFFFFQKPNAAVIFHIFIHSSSDISYSLTSLAVVALQLYAFHFVLWYNFGVFLYSKMEVLLANVDHIKFDIDYALEEQYGALPLPFPGMDSM